MARRKSVSVLSLGIGGYFTIRRTRYDSHCYDSVRLLHEDHHDPTPHGGTQLELLFINVIAVRLAVRVRVGVQYAVQHRTLSVGQ